jgi:acetyl-CoA C-acetyltransferase
MLLDNTPIIVGVGQTVVRLTSKNRTASPTPQSLRAEAAKIALHDSGSEFALTSAIDRVVVIRTMADSVSNTHQAFGRCEAPASTLMYHCGIKNARSIYSVVGGDQPQAMVNEAAEAIFVGEAKAILLAGSEATAQLRNALKEELTLDWSESSGVDEDRGLGDRLLTSYEYRNGLGAPTVTYPAFEHALRRRLGRTRAEHANVMAALWTRFSKTASENPYSQYPDIRDEAFLKTASPENYPIADPYLKWHVAQDAVNQGAAVILTSVSEAKRMGIDPSKWVFLHGYAKATDCFTSERPDLSRSDAMDAALNVALAFAGKLPSDIAYWDLYSCFPCAVLLAAEILGIDPLTYDVTVTGGLPFFGGAGNNYTMHAIASMTEKLRAKSGSYGLILANGGFLSKEAVGVYSTEPAENWIPNDSTPTQNNLNNRPKPALLSESGSASIETYSVLYTKGKAKGCYVIARSAKGRFIARNHPHDSEVVAEMVAHDPLGRVAEIIHEDGTNYIQFIA